MAAFLRTVLYIIILMYLKKYLVVISFLQINVVTLKMFNLLYTIFIAFKLRKKIYKKIKCKSFFMYMPMAYLNLKKINVSLLRLLLQVTIFFRICYL